MGVVYAATHDRLPGLFAVKTVRPDDPDIPQLSLRMKQEAQILSRLRHHPNIVRLVDFNMTSSGLPYMVMEYLDGDDLGELLRTGAFPPWQVAAVVRQVAAGLSAAHACDIVHRDLKPENVMIVRVAGAVESVKLIDFGVSKALWSSGMGTAGQLIGTPDYMAPEQAQGGGLGVDARADQFALAAMTYEMLTGESPFSGHDTMTVIYRIVHDDVAPLGGAWRGGSNAVEVVLRRALAKDPRARFPGVLEFSGALDQALLQDVGGGPQPIDLLSRLRTLPRTDTSVRPWTRLLAPLRDAITRVRSVLGARPTRAERGRGRTRRPLILVAVAIAAAVLGLSERVLSTAAWQDGALGRGRAEARSLVGEAKAVVGSVGCAARVP